MRVKAVCYSNWWISQIIYLGLLKSVLLQIWIKTNKIIFFNSWQFLPLPVGNLQYKEFIPWIFFIDFTTTIAARGLQEAGSSSLNGNNIFWILTPLCSTLFICLSILTRKIYTKSESIVFCYLQKFFWACILLRTHEPPSSWGGWAKREPQRDAPCTARRSEEWTWRIQPNRQ